MLSGPRSRPTAAKKNTILNGHPESYAAFPYSLLAVATFSFFVNKSNKTKLHLRDNLVSGCSSVIGLVVLIR
jgi:hypothetical protein